MILYHTSNMEIRKPDIAFSRNSLDFGRGFYTTENKSQAEKYARRFFKQNEPAVMNIYSFDDGDLEGFSRKFFAAYDAEWLDYVEKCRREQPHEHYDIVEGGIANDNVFDTLDLYMARIITHEQAIGRLKKKKPNQQICFTNQTLIDLHLHFVESISIEQL